MCGWCYSAVGTSATAPVYRERQRRVLLVQVYQQDICTEMRIHRWNFPFTCLFDSTRRRTDAPGDRIPPAVAEEVRCGGQSREDGNC